MVKDLLVSDGDHKHSLHRRGRAFGGGFHQHQHIQKLKLEVSEGVISIEGDSDLYFKPTEFSQSTFPGKLKDLDIGDAFKLNIEQPDMDEFKLFHQGRQQGGTIKLGKTDKF